MPRDVALLVNPTAGRGRARRLVEPVAARLRDLGCTVRVLAGAGVEQAHGLARAEVAAGVEVLAVLGGDGMCHLALQAVAGTRTTLAIVPAGTGNDLCATVGLPADPIRAAEVIAAGTPTRFDLGRADRPGGDRPGTGETWWGTVLCAGFDARVNERANRMRWPRGPRRYDLAVLAELYRLRPRPATVTMDGERWQGDVTLVAIGNGARYGGGQYICPDARPDDGLLDVAIVRPLTRRQVVALKPKLSTGELRDHPAVIRRRVSEVRLEIAGLAAYADGERVGPLPVRVRCVPGALRVLVPTGSRARPTP
ncbi:MAG TPA: diacylglycerol kinase family protein [Mycobacteriales bacterium]|nr:diacylglycerol kinase family protein [Mycobacteriales bacterium]